MSIKVNLLKQIIAILTVTINNKKQLFTNNLTNYITKGNSTTNNETVFNIKDVSTNHYITNVFRSNNDYIGNNIYIYI